MHLIICIDVRLLGQPLLLPGALHWDVIESPEQKLRPAVPVDCHLHEGGYILKEVRLMHKGKCVT